MGSPSSSQLAHLVMDILEEDIFQKIGKPFFYIRYIDDYVIIIHKLEIENLMNAFNSYENKLNLTIEKEINKRISFLDILVERQDNGNLLINWYRKPTWSDRYLYLDSSAPIQYKINTVNVLSERILKKLTSEQHQNDYFELLIKALKTNSNPPALINKQISHMKTKLIASNI